MPEMIGQTVGNYRILEKRGEGGMGMFFKAVDLHLDRVVGLKTLKPELLADPELRQRLQSEAKSLARLVHPNIANVLHYLVADDMAFIVMEYVEGFDLAEIVRHDGLFDMPTIGSIVGQVCAAVGYAHGRNVIHRDLKPSNIMMTKDGTCKVTDFGIAKVIGASVQTRTGMAAGSLHYMAPEQIRAAGVDARTDIYQLGAMIFELTTGRRPFVSDSEYDLMTMHLQERPELPSSVNNRVSPAIDSVILKALEKSPDDRYASTEDLDRAFQEALNSGRDDSKTVFAPAAVTPVRGDDSKTAFAPPSPPKTPVESTRRTPPPPRRADVPPEAQPGSKKGLVIGGVALVAIAAVAIGYWLTRSPASTEVPLPPETNTTAVAPCTLVVQADLPAGFDRTTLARTFLSINHPDSGSTRVVVDWTGNRIEHPMILGPAGMVQITVEGVDAGGKKLLVGDATSGAPSGSRLPVNVPLRSLVVAENNQRPPDKPPTDHTTPAATNNLAINITPFSERGRIGRVWIDDKQVQPDDDFEFRVAPGLRRVRVQIGNDRLTDTVTVPPSGKATADLFIGSGRGRLSVAALFGSEGGYADIVLDGLQTGFGTPYEIRDVLEGPHEVEVTQEGYRARGGSQIVIIRAGDRARAEFSMNPR